MTQLTSFGPDFSSCYEQGPTSSDLQVPRRTTKGLTVRPGSSMVNIPVLWIVWLLQSLASAFAKHMSRLLNAKEGSLIAHENVVKMSF